MVALLEDADRGGQFAQLGVLLGRAAHREIWLRGPGRAYLRPEETTVAQVLRQAGSATANFGKTHAIGIDKKLGPQRNRHFGFDQFLLDYEYAKNWLGPNFPLSVVSQDGITEFPVNAEIERTMTENYGPQPKEHTSGYIEKYKDYDHGIRVPMIVRCPKKIKAGSVSDVPWYFADAFPTFSEIGNAHDLVPDDLDGLSVLPTLLGQAQNELDERPMFWEGYQFFGFHQVVRKGNWKLIRWTKQGRRRHPVGDVDPVLPLDKYPMLELYNLAEDHREEHNLADKETAVTDELLSLLNSAQAHTNDPCWPLTKEEQQAMESE